MTKKDQILDTMLQLVARQGIQATPMSQIAKVSGVATGTIYHHFKSKEEIINEIYLNKKRDFQQIIEENFNEKHGIKRQFSDFWKGWFFYYLENPLIFSFTLQLAGHPVITKKTIKKGERYYQGIFAFFQKAIDSGEVVKMDVHLMAELIHANISKIAELCITKGREADPKLIKEGIAFSWRAIAV